MKNITKENYGLVWNAYHPQSHMFENFAHSWWHCLEVMEEIGQTSLTVDPWDMGLDGLLDSSGSNSFPAGM